MIKRFMAVLVAVAALVGVTAMVSPAQAANSTPYCMTKTEWSRIKPWMTRTQVTRIVGAYGKVTYSHNWGINNWARDITVEYRQCWRGRPSPNVWDTVSNDYTNSTRMAGYGKRIPFTLTMYGGRGGWTTPFGPW